MNRQLVVRVFVACVFTAFVASVATPAFAQLGSLKGKVVDAEGKPVPDAELVFEYVGGYTFRMTAKTNAKGEWARSGMQATEREGFWNISVTKGDLGARAQAKAFPAEITELPDIVLRAGGAKAAPPATAAAAAAAAKMDAETRKNAAAADKLIADANTAIAANNFDAAISALTSATSTMPTCAPCYAKLGEVYSKKPDAANAEKAFLKAIELDPKLAPVYDMLASLYNQQKKFEDAGRMSAKATELRGATGGGDAGSSFNAGIILWNQDKMPEAQAQFERAVQLDPKMAEAHYQLGMTLVNQGKLPEAKKALQQYLALSPDGKNAATAKAVLSGI